MMEDRRQALASWEARSCSGGVGRRDNALGLCLVAIDYAGPPPDPTQTPGRDTKVVDAGSGGGIWQWIEVEVVSLGSPALGKARSKNVRGFLGETGGVSGCIVGNLPQPR